MAADILASKGLDLLPSSSVLLQVLKSNIVCLDKLFVNSEETHLGKGPHFSGSAGASPKFLAQVVSILGLFKMFLLSLLMFI
jgi:hypothetical protein